MTTSPAGPGVAEDLERLGFDVYRRAPTRSSRRRSSSSQSANRQIGRAAGRRPAAGMGSTSFAFLVFLENSSGQAKRAHYHTSISGLAAEGPIFLQTPGVR